jgi:DNA-3-methyladenine glycosylase II
MTVLSISPVRPHDFELSLRVARSFSPEQDQDSLVLRSTVRIQDNPTVLELHQIGRDPVRIEIRTEIPDNVPEVKQIARRIISADLDLLPFYKLVSSHSVLGPITKKLYGLKPIRPASLFEMLVIAVTEQQISLAAAYHIRTRIVERFGDPVNGLWAFPTPKKLNESSAADLMTCGLSQRKAEYVKGLAYQVVRGQLDLDRLEKTSDEDVRSLLLQVRGLGPWSAEYFLVRGLSRPDRVPADDLAVRSVVGHYLGRGQRLSPQGTMRKLSLFKPYRGLAAFYLLAHMRLTKTE